MIEKRGGTRGGGWIASHTVVPRCIHSGHFLGTYSSTFDDDYIPGDKNEGQKLYDP